MTRALDHARRIGWVGWLALAAWALALIVCARGLVGVGRALLAPSADRSVAVQDERLGRAAEDYSRMLSEAVAQVDGRSIFFVPSAPIPPPPPPTPIVEVAPPPPPPPTTYGGPSIIAMVNGAVWFADGTRLSEGESSGTSDVKVIRIEMPWHAVVEWKGIEFKVSLFDRDRTVIRDAPPPSDVGTSRDGASSPSAQGI